MTYIPKIVGPDEKLVGIARLHWIYLAKGIFAFVLCTAFGYVLNLGLGHGMAIIYQTLGTTTYYDVTMHNYIMPLMMGAGFFIFMVYLFKVIGTEIGLTTRRIINKQGIFFIKVHEIDIEEVRGTSMDLGWFGGILGYAFLKFDCRFVGDVTTPAVENPERFVRAMHQLRAEHIDSLSSAQMAAADILVPAKLMGEQPKPGEQPERPIPEPAQPVPQQPTPPPARPPEEPLPSTRPEVPQAPPETPVAPPMAPPLAPPQMPPPNDPQQPPLQAAVAPPAPVQAVDPKLVAQIINQAMPQMVEKITDELAAKGLIPEQDNTPGVTEAELLSSFDEASKKKIADQESARRVVH